MAENLNAKNSLSLFRLLVPWTSYRTAAAIELNPDTGCQTLHPDEEAGAENWKMKI